MAERIEGLSIGLDLETMKVDSGLTNLNSKLKLVNSEMKANMSAFDRSDKSITKYETRLKGLNKKLEVQKTVTDSAKKSYEKMVKEHGEGSEQAEKAAKEYNNQAAALNNLERYIDRTTEELKQMTEQQRIAESGWGKLSKKMETTGAKLTNVGSKMKDTGKSMSMFITAPLVGLGAVATKTGIDFDDSMRKVQSTSGATGDEITQLRDKAKEMGASTKFSASESAEALNYMALAGWDTKQMMGGISGVMDLAAASGEDLASVSDIVTDGLSAFGLEAKDSARMADVLAAASSSANTDVAGLGNAFKYVAPVAGALKFSIEDTSKAIGLMSNAGIKGEKAGTALRTMMTNLSKPTAAMEEEMDRLGISLTDSEGNMKSFEEIMQDMRKGMGGLTEQQQASAAATIFGKEAMSGALAIVNASEKDYDKLGKAIGESEGAAKRMSEIMEGGLGGTLRKIKAGVEGLSISVFEDLQPALEKGAEKVEGFVTWLNNLSPKLRMGAIILAAFAAAIGPILVAGGLFLGLLGNIMTGLAPVMTSIAKAGGFLKWLRLGFVAITGPIGLTIAAVTGLTTGFIIAYKKSSSFRDMIDKLVVKLKELGGKALEMVKVAVDAVVDFFKQQLAVIKQFWKENSDTIIQSLQNIGKFVSVIFSGILKVTQFVMPFVLSIIKSIWGNIKGVITGSLNIIMGLVKVFSGLLTGDFSKMWKGVKQIFSGALKFIWNFVQLMFWGKMLKGIISLGKLLLNAFKGTWSGISNIFTSFIKSIVNFTSKMFTGMKNWLSKTFNNIKSGISNTWSGLKNGIVNTTTNLVNTAKSKFFGFKNKTFEIFRGIKDKVAGYVTDMIDGVKAMPGKMKDGLVKAGHKVKEGVTSIANKMAKGLGKGVNGVITGVNWVTGKLGVKSKIPEWDVPQYAKGTNSHPGGVAMVGDGKGSNAGSELIRIGSNYHLSPDKPTLVNLPKGAEVLPASLTKNLIPKYAWGTKLWEGAKNVAGAVKDTTVKAGKAVGRGVKAGAGAVKDFGLNVWDYAKNPSKLLSLALKGLGISAPSGATTLGKIARGGFNTVKTKAVSFIKKKMDSMFDFGSGKVSGNVKSWITEAMKHTGVPGNWAGPLATIAMKESGGRTGPSTINKWDSNWRRGTPSMGLMQTIRPTFESYKGRGMNDIMNPVHNAVAAINYIKSRYGSVFNVPGIRAMRQGKKYVGYKTGGLINNPGLYELAEGGYPEWVIPTDPKRRTDAMKLLALAGKDIGNKRPNQLPDASYDKGLEKKIDKLLDLLSKSKNTEINQNLHFYSSESTPAETARKQKQASRELAMEWR
ncbi:phage tail tape measure protein [Virgibacillus halodenitrificans]|uniref:phage tail tape measure protein n=1 Tax=Virgibacillus halodenitrificans TaxID=1482 RepID=UPI001FB54ACE|nr:phage tail tape measure protein [Virgibacillus halodenitrificans]MCJ0932545.1 phage tail tape measure protein [Virgibacillus halodenitrificans]